MLSIVAAALLAGCGGSQPPIGAPGAMPQSQAIASHAARGKSWMLPEAAPTELLYVADYGVGVYPFIRTFHRGLSMSASCPWPTASRRRVCQI